MTVATLSAKIICFKFQQVWILPAFTAIVCFVLEYANPGRWLTRRNLVLLSIVPLLGFVLVLFNDPYQLLWHGSFLAGFFPPQQGKSFWFIVAYILCLGLINLIAFAWLFIRSPQHRWPVVLMLAGQITARGLYLLDAANTSLFDLTRPFSLYVAFPFGMYAIALFRFHIFDLVPFARQAALEQMCEAMLVFDPKWRVASLNPAAESILGMPSKRARGHRIGELLPSLPDLSARLDASGVAQVEIDFGTGQNIRHYAISLSPLKDHRGVMIGHLALVYDVSEQKKAQAQLLEQQRVVATLQERERLARELHDSLGQVLGYVSLQAQAIHKWVRDGKTDTAAIQLAQLVKVAQEAHNDVRGSILNLKTGPAEQWSFLAALRRYLAAYQEQYGIRTELGLLPEIDERTFDSDTGVQVLRVIQEALTNARKHGHARCVQVNFEQQDSQMRIIVADDGSGFDPGQLAGGGSNHFGLAFMRERMEQIDIRLAIESQPGAGTRVVLDVPVKQ
jgi:PAS domain S-box-containing protein